jgi:PPM family protein phosphatase
MPNRNAVKPFVIRAAGCTDIGCVRKRNEDAFYVDAEAGVFIVADGIGGHGGGDMAAKMATTLLPEFILRRLAELPAPRPDNESVLTALIADAIAEISQRIREASANRLELKDMGATVVIAMVTADHIHIAHMGDSRAYLLRGDNLQCLTEDHSIIGLLIRNGEITLDEAENHPAKGRLSRYVGMEAEVYPATQAIALEDGDRLLLCTDGLWGMLTESQLKAILAEDNAPEVTCRQLVEAGKRTGGQDNLTAVICDH